MKLYELFSKENFLILENADKKFVVVYGGRFQPPTPGHFEVYKHLVNSFGEANVYIATSNDTDIPKIENYFTKLKKYHEKKKKFEKQKESPNFKETDLKKEPKPPVVPKTKSFFNFEEKKFLWNKLFNVPPNKIIYSKSPVFRAFEILNRFPKDTVYITVIGEKDKDRVQHSNFFEPYPTTGPTSYVNFDKIKDKLKGYEEKVYYILVPNFVDISATVVRNIFNSDLSEEEKKKKFYEIYKKFDEQAYNLINTTLSTYLIK